MTLNTVDIRSATGAVANTVTFSCTGRCLECQYVYLYQDFAFTPGDWLVAGTFSISQPGPDGQRPYVCGNVRTTNGFLYSAAMMYAINRINRYGNFKYIFCWAVQLIVLSFGSFRRSFSKSWLNLLVFLFKIILELCFSSILLKHCMYILSLLSLVAVLQ